MNDRARLQFFWLHVGVWLSVMLSLYAIITRPMRHVAVPRAPIIAPAPKAAPIPLATEVLDLRSARASDGVALCQWRTRVLPSLGVSSQTSPAAARVLECALSPAPL